jgi:queuine tRNA-ribosyltransferase
MQLPHGPVETPAFMPVGTNATVKATRLDQLAETGISLILSNTYHLLLRPGIEVIRAAGGLHQFMAWDGNILTDSGGFQVFSLAPFRSITDEGVIFKSHLDGSRHRLTPESVLDLQSAFGSDIIMPLDVCTAAGISEEEAVSALEQTTRWAERSKKRWEELGQPGQLFGIVQGNFYPGARKRSAEEITALDLPGYALGGLSVGENFELFCATMSETAQLLPVNRPRYVMGIGTPDYILEAVEVGIDIFDCVYPTRISRNALAMTRDGNLNLRLKANRLDQKPIDPECRCHTCMTHSRSYLRHLFKAKEIQAAVLTTIHNLRFIQDLMEGIRAAIREGRFGEFKRGFLRRRSGSQGREGEDAQIQ